jgi:hypothetical protein
MDLADRYLNTVSSRYYLRCDEIETADKLIGLFAKRDEDPNSKKKELKKHNMHEVQCYCK